MFVRMCPYFPFSARVCLNQHHWLALRMQQQGITFRQCKNAFLQCSDPQRLQQLADSLTAQEVHNRLILCRPLAVAGIILFVDLGEVREYLRRTNWHSFPDVVILADVPAAKRHPLFSAAKAGDARLLRLWSMMSWQTHDYRFRSDDWLFQT
jgi:hypothetical protein